LLKRYEPSVIRLALMNYHYRSGGEWRPELLPYAAALYDGLRQRVAAAGKNSLHMLLDEVRNALDDNLDTPRILRALQAVTVSPASAPMLAGSSAEARKLSELLGIAL
jgi:L-cysteine:1D-myo-inositol 2-amino-2-deoxy-alpha-D-glucopyranoside ligase